jgi:hypothetical protein
MIDLSCCALNVSMTFMTHSCWMHLFRGGGALHINVEINSFTCILLKTLIGCHQSPKRGRLKVNLGPCVDFGCVITNNWRTNDLNVFCKQEFIEYSSYSSLKKKKEKEKEYQ